MEGFRHQEPQPAGESEGQVEDEEEDADVADITHAREMLEFLVFDPASALSPLPRFSLCALPTSFKCDATDMLLYLGQVLEDGGEHVRTIVCDNAGSHRHIKQFMLGINTGLAPGVVQSLPFWKKLTYKSLPETRLPRLPWKAPLVDGQFLFGWNGPCHLQKNLVGNLRSPARTLAFGQLWCDPSGALDLKMPAAAYIGYDGQSDRESASFLNPYHLNVDMSASIEDIRIPWCLRGLLCMNLTGSLCISSVLHPGLTVPERLENSLASFVLLDLGSMLAAETAQELGVHKGACWLHPATHCHLQQLTGFTAIACAFFPSELQFRPWDSTELNLEQYFGTLRRQFQSCQMTVRDYVNSSAKAMKKTLKLCTDHQENTEANQMSSRQKLKRQPLPDNAAFRSLSETEFEAAADRALDGALSLMSCCCQYSTEELLTKYASFCGAKRFQNLMAETDEPDVGEDQDFEDDFELPPVLLQAKTTCSGSADPSVQNATQVWVTSFFWLIWI